MFLLLALGFAAAGFLHGFLTARSDPRKRWELALVYLLAGYFGAVMILVALFVLAAPERAADWLAAEPGSPFQPFLGIAYLALAVIAALAAFVRGRYLLAPLVGWSVFFFSATAVHLTQYHGAGHLEAHAVLVVVREHALPPLLAIALALRLRALERR